MSKETKLTDKEMETITKARSGFDEITVKFGQVEVEIANLSNTKEMLVKQLLALKQQEQQIVKDITDKYGDGELDINTGVFISK